jgi:hypothetical protein
MKPPAGCRRLAAAALLIAACAPIGATPTRPAAPAVCPPEIIGTWRLTGAADLQANLIAFSQRGWADVMTVEGADRSPAALEIVAQVRYEPVPRRDPRRIEFQARRGNDLFPAGTSSWQVVAHTDESLTTRRSDSETGQLSLWSRVQTHRYFLTLAARPTAAFVMWTRLDGKKTELEALGAASKNTTARFGRIPDELTKAFATESDPKSERRDDVMMRIELSEAEYLRSRQVFEAWNTLLSGNALADADPYAQAVELLQATVQSVNRCSARLRPAEASTQADSQRTALELVRAIRKANDRRHINDKIFPFRWQPPPVT